MIQEIITFMIIGAAVALAISKLIGKIKGKKRAQKNQILKRSHSKWFIIAPTALLNVC
jgi:large-conductance mechanosensitive channel